MSKFGNKKVDHRGYSFASKLEAAVFDMLRNQELAGEIAIVRVQAQVYLTKAKILYKPDFECLDLITNYTYFVEAKGFETDVWRIKRRLWEWYGPGDLHIYKGSHARPYLHEVIKGKQ